MSIIVPLQISKGRFARSENLKQSIDSFLELLLSTPCYSCPSDPQFGFVFKNLRFEIFNENEGVVYNAGTHEMTAADVLKLYDKKITGLSKNLNTFAAELKDAVEKYERRLSDVSVAMVYVREEKNIYVTIKGTITDQQTAYQYNTVIRVWH